MSSATEDGHFRSFSFNKSSLFHLIKSTKYANEMEVNCVIKHIFFPFKGTHFDPVRINEIEGHALEEDVEEEPGMFQEACHHEGVCVSWTQDGGQVFSQFLMDCPLVFCAFVWPKQVLQVESVI